LKARKPALMAATLALAIAPALTAITPAHASPRAALVAAAEDPTIKELIIACFPEPLATDIRNILDLKLEFIFTALSDALNLTPAQLNEIFVKISALATQLGGGAPPTPTATDSQSVALNKTYGMRSFEAVKPLTAKEAKAVKLIKTELKQVKNKKLTQNQAANLAISLGTLLSK
jgi:hypothetical protein